MTTPSPAVTAALIDADQIIPVYQPIVDLTRGEVPAYELLSRPPAPYENPLQMFEEARRSGTTWEVERACRRAALQSIASLPAAQRRETKFFINVSPDVFNDPRFVGGFTLAALNDRGLDQRSIVLEITERDSIADHRAFEEAIRHYVDQGFEVAVDDFGSGHSSLLTLISCVPRYLKLDMQITRDVHMHPYKQAVLKSVVSLAGAVDADLIAEGVESWRELETLVRHGVRFAQGWLLGKPSQRPAGIAEEVRNEVLSLVKRWRELPSDEHDLVTSLMRDGAVEEESSVSSGDVIERFQKNAELEALVLTRRGEIAGLVTRESVFSHTAGPFGYALLRDKPSIALAKVAPLCAAEDDTIHTVSRLAMQRESPDVYDPVIVIDRERRYRGIVTIRQLLSRSAELAVARAEDVNPLTRLPGNREIRSWLQRATAGSNYTLIYCDLNNFKEFNDRYGFVAGDDMLLCAAQTLSEAITRMPPGARLGHIGGDDFVIVATDALPDEVLESICTEFDRRRLRFFTPAEREEGFYTSTNRSGDDVRTPLTTLTLAVMTRDHFTASPHLALIAQAAASLKQVVKKKSHELRRSTFLRERRARNHTDLAEETGALLERMEGSSTSRRKITPM